MLTEYRTSYMQNFKGLVLAATLAQTKATIIFLEQSEDKEGFATHDPVGKLGQQQCLGADDLFLIFT